MHRDFRPGPSYAESMSKPTVPDEVRRFILTSIPSVPYLEALLLLRGNADASWDALRAAARLYIGEAQALGLLHALLEASIARRLEDGSFVYGPGNPQLREVLDALALTYSQNLVGVTDLIHSRVEKRAQQFADAFRWKKESG
jgi:hypothetical protein